MTKSALDEFDSFCRFIDGLHMNTTFVENDFMSKPVQKLIRDALLASLPAKDAPKGEAIDLGPRHAGLLEIESMKPKDAPKLSLASFEAAIDALEKNQITDPEELEKADERIIQAMREGYQEREAKDAGVDVEAIESEFRKAFRGNTKGAMRADISRRIKVAIRHLASRNMLKTTKESDHE